MPERRRRVRKQKKLDQQRAKGWRKHRRNVAEQYGCPTPQKRTFESRYAAEQALSRRVAHPPSRGGSWRRRRGGASAGVPDSTANPVAAPATSPVVGWRGWYPANEEILTHFKGVQPDG